MKRIRRILVALDLVPSGGELTPGSRLALEQALAIAPVLAADLTLLHATAPDEAWDDRAQDWVVRSGEDGEARRPILEEACARARVAGLGAELVLSEERAALAIVRRAVRGEADLVISGKRNHSHHVGHRLGSIAAKLLRKCPCPVWVVNPDSARVPGCILAATDLEPVGTRVIELAAFVADQCDAELHVVHAFSRPLSVQMGEDEASLRYEEEQRAERREQIERAVAATGTRREARIHLGLTSPTRAILTCEERFHPDLVVMGTVSRGGIAGLLVGNTAERLLSRLDASLLTVKPDDFVCPVAPD